MKITFYGGAQSVTGANFLVELQTGKRLLFDCGMFQGGKVCEKQNREPFPYDPASIDYLFVSHPHLDHTGRIPKLVRDGFRGTIYSTPPTKDLAEVMLEDSLGVLEKEAKRDGEKPFFDRIDITHAMRLWESLPYHQAFPIDDENGASVTLYDAGHVLGSAIVVLTAGGKVLAYTGDLGNSPAPLLPDTDFLPRTDYLMIESVYGDRMHEHREERKAMLERAIEESVNRKGILMIPAFSLERTQEVIFEIKMMMEGGKIPKVPVYLDSPLAIKVTDIYERYHDYLRPELQAPGRYKDIFSFTQLHPTLTTEESKAIAHAEGPMVIIAGAGMSNGGRIVHHEQHYLPDPKNMILFLGYQAPGTLGRIIQEGAAHVKINGEQVPVRAEVRNIAGYSAHKDCDGLYDFIAHAENSLKQVFVVLGEPRSSLSLVQRVRDNLGMNAIAPEPGECKILNDK